MYACLKRDLLIEAGLGPKIFSVPLCSSGEEFREIILSKFPKLKDGGGFDLLRCIPNTKHLHVISPSDAQSASCWGLLLETEEFMWGPFRKI